MNAVGERVSVNGLPGDTRERERAIIYGFNGGRNLFYFILLL
jgi:hypothetical protein